MTITALPVAGNRLDHQPSPGDARRVIEPFRFQGYSHRTQADQRTGEIDPLRKSANLNFP